MYDHKRGNVNRQVNILHYRNFMMYSAQLTVFG